VKLGLAVHRQLLALVAVIAVLLVDQVSIRFGINSAKIGKN